MNPVLPTKTINSRSVNMWLEGTNTVMFVF